MANITLGGILLPPDLRWTDEFQWSHVRQLITPSVDGSIIIQSNTLKSGRPITLVGELEGNEGYAWIFRTTVEALRSLESASMTPMVLTFSDGREFHVVFRYDSGNAIEASPIKHIDPPLPLDYYTIKIKLMVVPEP